MMTSNTITEVAPPEQLLRLGTHAEKDYFEEDQDLFDVAVFNANLVEYTAGAVASFVIGTLENKPFFIDPITHAFGHSPRHIMRWKKEEDGTRSLVVKRSIGRLSERYGGLIRRKVEDRGTVSPSDFSHVNDREELCMAVVDFQMDRLHEELEEDRKYLEDDSVRPALVIPPYFYMDVDSFESWLPINSDFASIVARSNQPVPVFAEVVIDRRLLEDKEAIDNVVRTYQALQCDGFLIWISGFSEHSTSRLRLERFQHLVSGLSSGDRPVYNLYGGYFSALLAFDGLSGFCHGPGYGEERNVVPVGGGVPRPKYYFTPLHNRFLHSVIELFLVQEGWTAKRFLREVCDCPVCSQVVDDDINNFRIFGQTAVRVRDDGTSYQIPTTNAVRYSIRHYMQARRREVVSVRTVSDRSSLLEDLRMDYQRFQPFFDSDEVRHLMNWARALGLQEFE